MMTFEEFIKEITDRINAELGEDYEVKVHEVLKNNSVMQPQLTIRKKDRQTGPAFYLWDQYERYTEVPESEEVKNIADSIIWQYEHQEETIRTVEDMAVDLDDYQNVSDKVLFKLVNTKDNQELLKTVPYMPYLDLSVVFYICLSMDEENGMMTALIKNEHMQGWNVTVEELYQTAEKNTPEKLPLHFSDIQEVINGIGTEMEKYDLADLKEDICLDILCDGAPKMYVLSNCLGINGASAALYPGVFKRYAELFRRDLFILPSSVHELLIIPSREDMNAQELSEMVKEINQREVPREEWLSDHAYRYDYQEKRLLVA